MESILVQFLLLVTIGVAYATHLLKSPYPLVLRDDAYVDHFHGYEVPDPYHWLDNLDSVATKKFVEDQNNYTHTFFASIPEHKRILDTLEFYGNVEISSVPVKRGHRYFFKERASDFDHHAILFVKDEFRKRTEVVVDINSFRDAERISLGDYSVSQNGIVLAFHLRRSGSEWESVHFINVTSKQLYPESLRFVRAGHAVSWTHDNQGVFYDRFAQQDGKPIPYNNKACYHRLGTGQEEDVVVAEFPEHPTWIMSAQVSEDGKYLVVLVWISGNENAVYVAKLEGFLPVEKGFQKNLVPIFTADDDIVYRYASNVNSNFFFVTDKDASNRRLISVNVDEVIEDKASGIVRKKVLVKDLIPEDRKRVLESACLIRREFLILLYTEDVMNTLEMRTLTDINRRTSLRLPPTPSRITDLQGCGPNATQFFFTLRSFANPGSNYRCDVGTRKFDCRVYSRTKAAKVNAKDFNMKQVFYRSKDGTSIPMYIVHSKNFKSEGKAPAILTAYGGFGRSRLPDWDLMLLFFAHYFRGVFAVANIRGGGEYGKHWADQGRRYKKQNSFDDFMAGAEYLIQNGYTNSKRLAAYGSANGGLVVAACVNQRPDLFGTAIINAGALDMLHFQNYGRGRISCGEYGCSDNKKDFVNLIKYSPLHNIRMPDEGMGQYPAVLVSAGVNDDRIWPAHSYKYISELQFRIGTRARQTNPLLLTVHDGGHTERLLEVESEILSFCMLTLGWEFHGNESPPPSSVVTNMESPSPPQRGHYLIYVAVFMVLVCLTCILILICS